MNEQEKTIQHVRTALDALEVKGDLVIIGIGGDPSRLEVFLNGKYFGIFDTNKNTFVD
ncbi:MAG: hypothetical protein ACI4RG_03335 [Huintestinicola sp.]